MKNKTFDCVEMKRRGAEYVYGITRDMAPEEEVEFWRKQTEQLRQEQQRLRAERPVAATPPASARSA